MQINYDETVLVILLIWFHLNGFNYTNTEYVIYQALVLIKQK